MKAVMLSIKPQWCELIASGKKTVEVRKTKPKLETPFKCYIYCTKEKDGLISLTRRLGKLNRPFHQFDGKVIGEFVCDKIIDIVYGVEEGVYFDGEYQKGFETNGIGNNPTRLSLVELENYLTNNEGYGWHISDLRIYDKPKELSEFRKPCIMPEQPYCPRCEVGGEYISETEAEFYRVDGECSTEWICNNYLKCSPQSWCYVKELEG